MHLNNGVYNTSFSHIYVEKEVQSHPRTIEILSHFPHANVILIDDYKAVFNRHKQSVAVQKQCQSLILAKKKSDFIYPASPVCQSFDERYFYYASSVMNCIYDCEYCFLKGMYPSGNLVVFVNLEDFFEEILKILNQHPLYLCVSYDADLLALESILNYGQQWAEFAEQQENLTIEIRTKGTSLPLWEIFKNHPRIILAITISPSYVIDHYEVKTPSFKQRLETMQTLLNRGYSIRLCLDPLLVFPNWKVVYKDFLYQLRDTLDFSRIRDISVGSFRISKVYLKFMRKQYPDSALIQYPYQCIDGFYQYPPFLQEELESYILELLKEITTEEKIYTWKETL